MSGVNFNSLIVAFLLFIVQSIHAEEKLPKADLFKVDGYTAFVMVAKNPKMEKPWVWYAPTLKDYPSSRHSWYFAKLVAKGISIAGIDLGEVRGSPASNLRFTAFYNEMVRRGYSRRPILLGQSRGGLMMLSWATINPDKLNAFVGIYPVCNLASWPLKDSKAAVLKDYAITEAELLANLERYNPIDNLQGLLKNKTPIFILHGNADEVVPYKENGKLICDRYKAAGGTITVKIVNGGQHEETNSFFECKKLLNFIVRQSRGSVSTITDDQTVPMTRRLKVQGFLTGNLFFINHSFIRDVAEVFINGKSAGILWKKPYSVDISQLVKPGINELKVEIVNLWVNRLTGDMLLDPKDRFCKTNQPYMKSEVWPGGDEPFRL